MLKRRVKSHTLEKLVGAFMLLFGAAALYIFFKALRLQITAPDVAIIEILLIIVLAILAQTLILIRIYEQHNL